MAGLFAFRKRIWESLVPSTIHLTVNDTLRGETEIQRGTKRKRGSDSNCNLESELKKLKLDDTEIKLEGDEDKDAIMRSIEEDETTVAVKIEKKSPSARSLSKRSHPKRRTSNYYNSDDSDVDAPIVKAKKEDIWGGHEIERQDHITAEDEGFEDWSQAEVDFFNALNDRGVVPMLWKYWKIDFPTLPESLFTAEKNDALIHNWKGNASSGAKALNDLIKVGQYARDRLQSGQDAAQLLAQATNAYIKWSFLDAKMRRDDYLPLIVVNFPIKAEDVETTTIRTEDQVRQIGEEYLDMWSNLQFECPPPTIFYILIARTFMGFGSYDASAEVPEFRNIFFTDWKDRSRDLWNAMAVAILVVQTRTWLAEVDPLKRNRKSSEPDPDL